MGKPICKHCEFIKPIGRTRAQGIYNKSRKLYFCENPMVNKITDNFGKPIFNFVGYGDTTLESPLVLKTCKKWCPKLQNL